MTEIEIKQNALSLQLEGWSSVASLGRDSCTIEEVEVRNRTLDSILRQRKSKGDVS